MAISFPTVHTNLYGARAEYLIRQLLLNFDGYKVKGGNRSDTILNRETTYVVTRAIDGEVIIEYHGYAYGSYSFRKCTTLAQQLNWLAWRIKRCAMANLEFSGDYEHDNWKRSNIGFARYFDYEFADKDKPMIEGKFTYREVYCIYDILHNRKNLEKQYTPEEIAQFVGEKRDPFATQMEVTRREEIDRLEKELQNKIHKLSKERYDAIEAARDKIGKEYDMKAAELRAEYAKLIKETNDNFTLATQLAS